MSSKMCLEILQNSKDFQTKNIKLNYSTSMKDVGKINLSKITGIFSVLKEIKKQIKEFKPDLIYFVPATSGLGFKRDFLFLKELKKTHKGKIIFHIRSRVLQRDWNNTKFKRKFINILSGEKVIILGKELIGDLHKVISQKNIFILPNAIENKISEKEFKEINKKRKQDKLRILFASNMDKTKGWQKVLMACKILNEKGINFECKFVGSWRNQKDKKEFENFITKNNLKGKVFSLGKKTDKDWDNQFREANVFVFPTEYPLETFGRVNVEAMMFGIPVISNSVATIPSIIKENKTGYLLKENSPEEIAKYLEKLESKKLRKSLGIEGRKRFLERYELSYYRKDFLKIINSI
ncbi:glycosyltransferase family 4 protein [archaeon]|nr:glycosyltransferase family 4 protein [archaeon]